MPHRPRPDHRAAHPVHVTLRAARVPSLRAQRLFAAVRGALARASALSFRVVQFSVQADHVHLLVEATDRGRLWRGVQGLSIRIARAVNRVLGRRGSVWSDRYHSRELRTPRETRIALRYVLLNERKHWRGRPGEHEPGRPDARWRGHSWEHERGRPDARWRGHSWEHERGRPDARWRGHLATALDPCSSAAWFDGWRERLPAAQGPPAVVRARTWLARVGWRRHGLLSVRDSPGR